MNFFSPEWVALPGSERLLRVQEEQPVWAPQLVGKELAGLAGGLLEAPEVLPAQEQPGSGEVKGLAG
jgi:hypothetical protein